LTWHKVKSKTAKKTHFLKDSLTLCGIDQSHLQDNINNDENKKCKVCQTIFKTYDNLDNHQNKKSASNNLRSNQSIEYQFLRQHFYNPLPPTK